MKSPKLLALFLSQAKGKAEIISFLKAVLTPDEVEEIERRLKIVTLLIQGRTQRDVSQKLNVSIATVTRGALVLKQSYGKVFKTIHARLGR